jgi:casein kinase I family protein HRR25
MVLERLGPSLEELFNRCHHKFSLKTVLLLSDQLVSLTYLVLAFISVLNIWLVQISRLEYVHSHNFVHRDIKPSNFLIGTGEHHDTISIIDFGLAKQYRNRNTHAHIPCGANYPFVGTAAFASINNHHSLEQSRRNDMESLAYVLIYFLRGSLPWYGGDCAVNNTKKPGIKSTRNAKVKSHINLICDSLPREFAMFLAYARALGYNETPDYNYVRNLFSGLLGREGYKYDYAFDWHTTNASPNNIVANIETKTIKRVTKMDSKPLHKV